MRSYAGKSSIHDQMPIFWDGSRRGNPMDTRGGTCFASLVLLLSSWGGIETGNGGVPMGRLLKHGN